MDERKLTELAKDALAESKRNDCEFVGARAADAGAWRVELMDVMLKREPFAVEVRADEENGDDEEIKDAIRRAVAEHFSRESY
ncbi:MAG: hypothetical protein ABR563_00170 [Pyrinomonadaceae bacterium]